jgi:hypothetical protein
MKDSGPHRDFPTVFKVERNADNILINVIVFISLDSGSCCRATRASWRPLPNAALLGFLKLAFVDWWHPRLFSICADDFSAFESYRLFEARSTQRRIRGIRDRV